MRESATVREALGALYAAYSVGDPEAFARLLARDAGVVIGTGPGEWLAGHAATRAAFAEQSAALPGLRLEAGDSEAWEDGAVGWAVDRPRFVLPDGTTVPARLTAVFRQADRAWAVVHLHLSIGVPDELVPAVLGGAAG
jgi:ketosteroid isomerase-like protein